MKSWRDDARHEGRKPQTTDTASCDAETHCCLRNGIALRRSTPGLLTPAAPDRETRSGLHVDCVSSRHEGRVGTSTYEKAIEVLHTALAVSRLICMPKSPSGRIAGDFGCVSPRLTDSPQVELVEVGEIAILDIPDYAIDPRSRQCHEVELFLPNPAANALLSLRDRRVWSDGRRRSG